MTFELNNGIISITADTYGAELISVKKDGKERLWQNGDGSWSGHAPVLFPVCGRFGVTVGGKNYDMPMHGFAKTSEFELIEKGDDFLKFVLRSNSETRKIFPYGFVLSVEYRIVGDALIVTYEIASCGDEVCFACGGHESFALDAPLTEYKLLFEQDEELVHYYHDKDGYLNGKTVEFGKLRVFDRLDEFLQYGETLIFGGIRSRAVTLCKRDGTPIAQAEFDAENLLLWRPNGQAEMLCIEPWSNLPDRVGESPTEFANKRGVYKVDSGDKIHVRRTIRYF